MKRIHLGLNVRGFLRNSRFPADYVGVFQHDDGRPMMPTEARDHLFDELANGHQVIPCGPCDNFDFQSGCRGHEDAEARG